MPGQVIQTEETLIIETPERVPLAFSLASIGNRFLAAAIDHTIQYFAIFFSAITFLYIATAGDLSRFGEGGSFAKGMPNWLIAVMILVLFFLFVGYFIIFEWLWDGQTPGKRLLKLRVIRDDGRPITLWEALARNLLRVFDAVPGFLIPIYSVGLIVIFLSGRDQRVGDIFAGTVVIRERMDEAPTFAETFSNPVSDGAFRRVQKRTGFETDISSIKLGEIEVIEAFLRRRWDLADRQRIWMAWRIALPIMIKLKPAYDAATFTYEGFLEELLHKYYAQKRYLN